MAVVFAVVAFLFLVWGLILLTIGVLALVFGWHKKFEDSPEKEL